MSKPFALVKFPDEEDSLAAVPVGWLDGDSHCFWPMASPTAVIRLAKSQADRNASGHQWTRCPVTVVASCRSYKSAEKKMRKYEFTSAVETSAVSGNEGHEDWPVEVELPSPPPLNEGAEVPAVTLSEAAGSESAALSSEEAANESGTVEAAVLRVLRILLEVRQQQRELIQRVQRIEDSLLLRSDREPGPGTAQPVSPPAPPPALALPAYTTEELEASDAALQDDGVAAALRQQLLRLGGKGLKEVAANAMTAIMGMSVQRLYSLHGRKGKLSFIGLRLCNVVTDVICQKTGVDVAEAHGFIKKWLPGSVDRGGGRKRRFA